MPIRARWLVPSLVSIFTVAMSPLRAQQPAEPIDSAMNAKIRAEGMDRSKIMWIEHYLTDVYGPRPIGSPNHVAAAKWAVKTMTEFGMKNAHLEPFTWRGVGWLPGKASGYITSPVKANLKFEAVPWSPSTKGTVSGKVVLHRSAGVSHAGGARRVSRVAGVAGEGRHRDGGRPAVVPVNFNERPMRTPDDQVRERYAPRDPNAAGRGGRGGAWLSWRSRPRRATPAPEGHLSARDVNQRVTEFLESNMPALRLNSQGGGRIPGVIVAQNGQGQIYDDTTPQPPAVILRNDDAGRIYRLIADGTPVTVEFNISNQFFPEGKTSYVTVAEIPGTDKADEVVMLGGHLDSWTSATGATDNAIGCAIMMEAARILEAVGRAAASHHSRGAVERRRRGPARLFRVCEKAFWQRGSADARISASSTRIGTSMTAPGACAARRSLDRRTRRRFSRNISSRSRTGACSAPRRRRRASKAAATTAPSPSPACRASARNRTASNTTAPRGTPISTRTSASCRKTSCTTRWSPRRSCWASPTGIKCCLGLRRTRCRRCRRRGSARPAARARQAEDAEATARELHATGR